MVVTRTSAVVDQASPTSAKADLNVKVQSEDVFRMMMKLVRLAFDNDRLKIKLAMNHTGPMMMLTRIIRLWLHRPSEDWWSACPHGQQNHSHTNDHEVTT
jgi:hypothetical protein